MEDNNRRNPLHELGGSDFEMRDGEPDIRGWDVKDMSGRHLGEVKDLLFEPASRQVRYLIVDLENNDLELGDRKVLVPVGQAQLHEVDDDVVLPYASAEHLRALPEYDKDRLDTDHEYGVRNAFTGTAETRGASMDETEFYNHEHFNEQHLYDARRRDTGTTDREDTIPVVREELEVGKREVETGRVRLRSRLEEKEVSENVNLREENVNVERTATDRPASEADMRERNVEMRERSEVPVVNKEARVVEEVRLNKEVNERDETIRDTVRNTELDADRKDGIQGPREGGDTRTDDDRRI